MKPDLDYLHERLKHSPVPLSQEAIAQYETYLALLLQWQQTFNLTAITDYRQAVDLHLLDSLSIAPFIEGESFVDVGTGAGLPGMVLAIAFPLRHFTLVESNGKKVSFLQAAKARLKLSNVDIVQKRSEAFQPNTFFDGVLTRAFADLKTMLNCTQHLCSQQGTFYAMKGQKPEAELAELPSCFEVEEILPLKIPGVEAARHLVLIKRR